MASGMYHVLSYLHEFNSLEMYMILDPWLLFRIKSLLFPTFGIRAVFKESIHLGFRNYGKLGFLINNS